jgi:serine/threonine protein kinase
VCEKLRLKISDFGLTRFNASSNKTSVMKTLNKQVGSILWMAPELMSDDPEYKKASDIFSMGVIFWEIFSRQIPWSNFNFNQFGADSKFAEKIKKNETEGDGRQKIPKDCPKSSALLIGNCWKTGSSDRPSIDKVIGDVDNNENDLKGSHQLIKFN